VEGVDRISHEMEGTMKQTAKSSIEEKPARIVWFPVVLGVLCGLSVGVVIGLGVAWIVGKPSTAETYDTWRWFAEENPKVVLSTECLPKLSVPPGGLWNLHTTYSKSTNEPVYQLAALHKAVGPVDLFEGMCQEGPVSASGKWHGETKTTIWEPFKQTSGWYWYGEQITEGEWHLRNRK
jgi:hypothetical protein